MKTLIASLLLVAVFICGCQVEQTAQPDPKPFVIGSSSDYGQYPTNYETLAKTWIHVFLKDPDTVKDLAISPPDKFLLSYLNENASAYLFIHKFPPNTEVHCYQINFSCISKNDFGAYGSLTSYQIYVRNGEVIEWSSL